MLFQLSLLSDLCKRKFVDYTQNGESSLSYFRLILRGLERFGLCFLLRCCLLSLAPSNPLCSRTAVCFEHAKIIPAKSSSYSHLLPPPSQIPVQDWFLKTLPKSEISSSSHLEGLYPVSLFCFLPLHT